MVGVSGRTSNSAPKFNVSKFIEKINMPENIIFIESLKTLIAA